MVLPHVIGGASGRVVVRGFRELAKMIDKRTKAIDDKINQILYEQALKMQARARELILRGSKNGREYRYGKNRDRIHIASAPDEAPANWTGNLARSIRVVRDRRSRVVVVQALAEYSAALEFGTERAGAGGTVRILKRPFMTPAYMSIVNETLQRLRTLT